MPIMDGLSLAKHIKHINPETKTIIMSAFDDKELLFKGIELKIFRFLKKPVNVTELAEVLYRAIKEIKHESNTKLFYAHLKSVFNYQSSMVIMLHNTKIVLANDMFLNFFNYESLKDCKKNIDDLGKNFLPHDGFLYNHDDINAIECLKLDTQKLYHVKLKNKDSKIKHFILKYQDIPEKAEHGVLSFDDVTELNLLELFDKKQSNSDIEIASSAAMFDLLSVIQRNSAKIEIHNYYNGLSITNNGIIIDIKGKKLVIKTTYMQQKAIQMEKKLLLISSALPYAIECKDIQQISFEKQTVELKSLKFVKTSPITRSTIRVVPSGKVSVSLFLGENKFTGDVEIEDISLNAVKLKLSTLPAGLDKDTKVILDMVFELDKRPLIVNTEATYFRKQESKHSFSVVFMFKDFKKSNLVKYITKRQMALIREIKGMQNG
jgi:CheY-like chemotaxis protein